MKRITALLCIASMTVLMTACAEKGTDYSNQTLTGKVTAVDGTKVTMRLGELSEQETPQKEEAAEGSQGETLAAKGEGNGESDGQSPPEMTSGEAPTDNAEGDAPPEKQSGGGESQPPPEIPSGSGESQTPPEMPSGSGESQTPPEMPSGNGERRSREKASLGERLILLIMDRAVDGSYTAGTNAGQMSPALGLAKQMMKDVNGLRSSAWIFWNAIYMHVDQKVTTTSDADCCDTEFSIN